MGSRDQEIVSVMGRIPLKAVLLERGSTVCGSGYSKSFSGDFIGELAVEAMVVVMVVMVCTS